MEVSDRIRIRMPIDAQILTVQTQAEIPTIWALVNPLNDIKERRFEIYGTGHQIVELPKGYSRVYIDTFQLHNGNIVFHVFEQIADTATKK